ncbi:S-layer homology domain-containing protein [Paenibacillus sp. SYP-B3998]|uniref:S-layer homology domain-containing protein n=1 Tax=Paenibacillus sp. SYP-B3998 TaxID=2678564 RepID=A0A6G3ZUS1_9BACL|nr:S-layer homology domain-containing protein [Paenibacillus sp. SYP-B3998]NEW05788.1 S-layer homology domain-containing protein [Paenibacillus sp. SYP-B3998]
MKKKLSRLVTFAMIFSMFATVDLVQAETTPATPTTSVVPTGTAPATPTSAPSVTPTTTPAPTKPASSLSPSPGSAAVPLDTQAKFKALQAKGILEGSDEAGTAALDQILTRAQLAKTIVLLSNLKEDKAAGSVYTDVDSSNWALGFIGAATKAGYMEGIASGHFDPAGQVTIEQAASVFVRVLKLKADESSAVAGTVSAWAKGNVAAAIEAGFITKTTDYTVAAKRELLVSSAYQAYTTLQAGETVPAVTKVSVAEFKATGAKTLWVKLNGAVADTTKLTISVLRGGSNGTSAASTPKWHAAKNEVTLTLDTKMTDGVYSVKLEAVKDGGLTIDKGNADVTVTSENITKIEFNTASDTLAQGKIKIGFKATNQYNEVSDLSASRFTILTSPELDAYSASDSQSLNIDVTSAVYSRKLLKDQKIEVRVATPDFSAQAVKSFTVGDPQSIAKIELGDITYVNGKTNLEAGDIASIAYKAFDQYGFQVTDLDVLAKNTKTYTSSAGVIDSTATEPPQGFGFVVDYTGDNLPELKVKAASTINTYRDQDVTLTVFAFSSGQEASKIMKVSNQKTPYEVSFGAFPNTIAVGDDDLFIPIIVKDQAGTIFNTDEVVNSADKIKVFGYGIHTVTVGGKDISGNYVGGIEKEGGNRGKIRISDLKSLGDKNTGVLTVKAMIVATGKTASYTASVVGKRHPNSVFLSVTPKVKMLPSLDLNDGKTENIFRLKYKDQYGEEFDRDYRGYTVQLSFNKISGSVTDAVYFSRGGYTWDKDTKLPNNPTRLDSAIKSIILEGVDATRDGYNPLANEIGYYRDKDLLFTSNIGDNNEGNYQLTAKLFKGDLTAVTAGTASLLSTTVSSTQLLKAKESDSLTYTITPFTNGIYTIDKLSGALQGAKTTVVKDVYSTEGYALENMFAGKVILTAKDSSGNIVQLPNNPIKAVTTSNPQVSAVVNKPKADGAVAKDFDGYGIRGKNVGTTSISTVFKPSNYTGYKFAFLENIAIKEEGLFASSLTASFNGKSRSIWLSALKSGVNIYTGNDTGKLNQKQTFSNITLSDQYGNNTFKNSSVIRVASVFGIQIFISNIRWATENIVPGSGYLAVESNVSGVNNVNGLANAPYPLIGPDAKGEYVYPLDDKVIGAAAGKAVDPTDWVFSSVNPTVRLLRGDAKYVYIPAKSVINGTDVEVASFTATMITANGKSISVDVFPDASK